MLKLEHLRSFIAAADTGSIATAGARLHMSPSAVSYAIDALGEELGTCLLIRRRSVGVGLTADGVRLVRVARPWLQQVADIDGMFTARERKLTGELIVGCQEALSWSLAPRAIAELSRRPPVIDVSLKTIFMDQGNRPLIVGADRSYWRREYGPRAVCGRSDGVVIDARLATIAKALIVGVQHRKHVDKSHRDRPEARQRPAQSQRLLRHPPAATAPSRRAESSFKPLRCGLAPSLLGLHACQRQKSLATAWSRIWR